MAKRGSNEGSIFKRKDGRWAATINLGWQEGKRKRKTFYGKTREDVQKKLTAALHTFQQGLPVASEKQTVGQFLTGWLEQSAKPTLRPRTFISYEELVRLHLAPTIGRVPLTKLSPQQVQALMNDKLASGLSPRRVQYIHAVLRRALGQAEKWSLVPRNVAKLVNPPRVQRAEISPFSPEEAREFLSAVRGDRLEALYSVALAVGLRQGEALGLSWKDIDLDAHEITVRSTLQRVGGKFRFLETKTPRSRRTVALPEPTIAALKTHKARQLQERLQMGSAWQDSGLVFTTPFGGPLSDGHVRRQFYRKLEEAGIRRQRFHDLRHACASLLLAQNVHPRIVMETLGHSTIGTTMNIYTHVISDVQRDAAKKMGELLTG